MGSFAYQNLVIFVLCFCQTPLVCTTTGQQPHASILSSSNISQQAPYPIQIGSSTLQTTKNKSTDLYSLARASAGQVVFSFMILPTADKSIFLRNVRLSTCHQDTQFDTVIYVLNKNPINNLVTARNELNFITNDVKCTSTPNRTIAASTLEQQIAVGETYYVVVSSPTTNLEGTFRLSLTYVSGSPEAVTWGLDRIDQKDLPLDGLFRVKNGGPRVFLYVLDSGIRSTHSQLAGRVIKGPDFVGDENLLDDCLGHGTHVAGIIAGQTLGVARLATLISVRVLDCKNRLISPQKLYDALDWVHRDALEKKQHNSSDVIGVVSMSINLPSTIKELNEKLDSMALDANLTIVVSAGNENRDACEFSFGSASSVITVGATTLENGIDTRLANSNYGPCVDIYAPGDNIWSAWYLGDYSVQKLSGTSQSTAFISGIVAVLLGGNPGLTPAEVKSVVREVATLGKIRGVPYLSSNRLAYVRSIPDTSDFGVPEKGYSYLFTELMIKDHRSCDDFDNSQLESLLAEPLSIDRAKVMVSCKILSIPSTYRQMENRNDSSILRTSNLDTSTASYVFYRVNENNLDAFRTFTKMKIVIEENENTGSSLGYIYVVDTSPWVVDDNGHILWSPPSIPPLEESEMGTGLIAAITVSVIALTTIVLSTLFVLHRKFIKNPKEDEERRLYASCDEDDVDIGFESGEEKWIVQENEAAGVRTLRDFFNPLFQRSRHNEGMIQFGPTKYVHTDGIMRYHSMRGETFTFFLDKASKETSLTKRSNKNKVVMNHKGRGSLDESREFVEKYNGYAMDHDHPKAETEVSHTEDSSDPSMKAYVIQSFGSEAYIFDSSAFIPTRAGEGGGGGERGTCEI